MLICRGGRGRPQNEARIQFDDGVSDTMFLPGYDEGVGHGVNQGYMLSLRGEAELFIDKGNGTFLESFPNVEDGNCSFEWDYRVTSGNLAKSKLHMDVSGDNDSKASFYADSDAGTGDVEVSLTVRYEGEVAATASYNIKVTESFRISCLQDDNGEYYFYVSLLPYETIKVKPVSALFVAGEDNNDLTEGITWQAWEGRDGNSLEIT